MRLTGIFRAPVGVSLATSLLFLASCATTAPRPQAFRAFFLPPQSPPAASNSTDAMPEPPRLQSELYQNEAPVIAASLPDALPRPSDTDFLLKRADDRLAAGRLAYQNGLTAEARREFNRALEILLSAPDNIADRTRVEHRLDDLIDTIYRYDVAPAAGDEDKVSYDEAPRDKILEMTFPTDPS